MPLDFATLDVQRVIVHEVPKRRIDGNSAPVLSEIESPLDDDLKLYIKEKITQSASSTTAFEVVFDGTTTSPVPPGIMDFLTQQDADFVAFSQQAATHLHQIQTGVNTEGLLMMADCLLQGCRCLAILKVEREAGVRIAQDAIEGKRTFVIEHIRELMLTQGTKVFKVGVFVHRGPQPADVDAVVCDLQRGLVPRYEVANFFLSKFLGCRLAEAPEVTTKRFFDATEGFIGDKVADSSCKARYQIALLAEMNSRLPTLNPRVFAETHLDTADRQRLIDYLESQHVPVQTISKDVSQIKSRILRMQVEFESGISLMAPGSVFTEKIRMTEQANGLTKVELEDRLKGVRGHR